MEKFIMRSLSYINGGKRSIATMTTQRLLIALTVLFSQLSFAEGQVTIFQDKGEAFSEVTKGIAEELDGEFSLTTTIIEKASKTDVMEKQLASNTSNLVILVGNSSVKLYSKYQKSSSKKTHPPSLIVAALFADKLLNKVENSTAILYEIPAVTSMVNLRSISKGNIKKVGVIYRKWMENIIAKNEVFLKNEGFQLHRIELDNKPSNTNDDIKRGLSKLKKQDIDAIWVVNDNVLLNGKTLSAVWIPVLSKAGYSVVVNAESLVYSKFKFGNFAVFPDHYGLGVQAANSIFEIADHDWSIAGRNTEEPLSVIKVLNQYISKQKGISLKEKALGTVDKIIEK